MKPIKSPHSRTNRIKTGERINNGRDLAEKTRKWMEDNEEAFFTLYRYVKKLQMQKSGGRVRDRVAIHCIQSNIDVGEDPYKFSNTYWAGIARYMVLYDPSLIGDPIMLRDSDIDCFGLYPVSYLGVA